jgi:predicted ester cyclase
MKKTIVIILISALFVIIFSSEFLTDSKAETSNVKAKEMVEAAQRADDAFSENDLEKYMSFFTVDFTHENVSGSTKNRAEFAEKITKFYKAFPGISNYQRDLLPYKNYLIFDECTFEIPLPDKGKTIKIFHMDIVEMEGAKLKVKKTFSDGVALAVALGKIKPPILLPPSGNDINLPNPKPTGLSPLEAQKDFQIRWNKHDLSFLAEMVHTDAEILVSPLIDPVGRNSYIEWQKIFFKAFPDISMTTILSYAGDNWAISEVMLKGTNIGPYIGSVTTGKRIELRAGYLTRFDTEGLITSLKLYFDSMNINKQLGLEPEPIVSRE